MTDEQSPESQSRRARLATRRKRMRIIAMVLAVVLVIVGAGTAKELSSNGAENVTSVPGKHTAGKIGPATEPNLGVAKGIRPPRPLSHANPLRLWIGGDSLAGSFGPALGQTAGATGVVNATIDYKVSSGLADQGIRDWYTHAQQEMASENPDAVVFIIGTNDASIVSSYDSNGDGVPDWEVSYRQKIDRMMETFVGGARHRTVFWLGPPTLGDHSLDKGAAKLGPVMRQEAKKFAPDVVFVDTYRLFEGPDGGYSRYLPDAQSKSVQMRISDGVHFTVDGAQYLADIIYKLLNKRWRISAQAQPADPITYTIAPGSNDYVPGVGRYRPTVPERSHTTSSRVVSSTTIAITATSIVPTTAPPTTAPPATTPPTAPHATTPPTAPHATTPPTAPPTT